MKSKDKILTYEQARDLKWFCQNVTGVRQDMYKMQEIVGKLQSFEDKITRLEKTCGLIENFLKGFEDTEDRGFAPPDSSNTTTHTNKTSPTTL